MTQSSIRDAWKKLIFPANELIDSRLQLHWAAQVMASVAAAHVAPRPDDSHRNMEWIADGSFFLGNLAGNEVRFRVALRPVNLELRLLDKDLNQIASFDLDGHTLDEGYSWAENAISSFSATDVVKLVRPEYDLPSHGVSEDAKFNITPRDLEELSNWYTNSDMVLRNIAALADDFSPIRCWPHHFDIGGLQTLTNTGDSGTVRSVSMGMTPGDGSYAEPYWYVTPWPYPKTEDLPQLPIGHWHREGWTGAVLLASEMEEAADPIEQANLVFTFVQKALAAATEVALSVPE